MIEYIEREALLENLHMIGGCGARLDSLLNLWNGIVR